MRNRSGNLPILDTSHAVLIEDASAWIYRAYDYDGLV